MKSSRLLVLITTALISSAGCAKLGIGGDSPTGPSGSNSLQGTWTGTLSRPNGLASMTVSWQAGAQGSDFGYVGPMTITNGTTTVTAPSRGSTAGNSNSGYTLYFTINPEQDGPTTGLAGCTVRASPSAGSPSLAQPFKNIAITLQVTYNGCSGLVTHAPGSNFLAETSLLTLTKQ
jgi:hypothetical protein